MLVIQGLNEYSGNISNGFDYFGYRDSADGTAKIHEGRLLNPFEDLLSIFKNKHAGLQVGFFAMPFAPIPDLLTTATALHALETLEVSFEHLKESCLDFIDSLWSTKGAFYGNWEEETLDCEYTFYGLLALGHLSL